MSAPDAGLAGPTVYRSGQMGLCLLLFGVFGGPIAWCAQFGLDYALAAVACFPNDMPLTQPLPGLAGSRALLIAINVLSLLVSLLAAGVSIAALRRPRRTASGAGQGRIGFMAACGVLTGLGFAVAILFDTFALATIPQCLG